MLFGAEARARLAALPAVVLMIPWLGVSPRRVEAAPSLSVPSSGSSSPPALGRPETSAATPVAPTPMAPMADEAPRVPFAPLSPLAPFGPFVLPRPLAPQTSRPPAIPAGGPAASAAEGKHEAPVGRVPGVPPHPPPVRMITLPEEVVIKAMGIGHEAFLYCWNRSLQFDPPPSSTKVRLRLELDGAGKITKIAPDTDSPRLASCLTSVARNLPFPAPGQPAVVDLPLMFR
jgi:hypothetical protein